MAGSCSSLLVIQSTINLPSVYTERGTGQYFYKDIDSDDKVYKITPSLLPNQLIISLTSKEPRPKQNLNP